MQILTTTTLILRRVALFVLVLGVLAVVARVEPGREKTKSTPLFAKIFKPKPASAESSGWILSTGWRKKG